jgi:hypothetical protein
LTAQGDPSTRFRRAIEGRWVFHAELAARECGNLTLDEALELVCLYAEAEPAKFDRPRSGGSPAMSRKRRLSLLSAQIALAALSELREEARPRRRSEGARAAGALAGCLGRVDGV